MSRPMPDLQPVLEALVRLGGEARTPQVAEEAGVSDSVARRCLERLKDQGTINKKGWSWLVDVDDYEVVEEDDDPELPRADTLPELDHDYKPGVNIAAIRSILNAAQLLIDEGKQDAFISSLAGALLAIDDLLEHAYHGEAPTLEYARSYILKGFDSE